MSAAASRRHAECTMDQRTRDGPAARDSQTQHCSDQSVPEMKPSLELQQQKHGKWHSSTHRSKTISWKDGQEKSVTVDKKVITCSPQPAGLSSLAADTSPEVSVKLAKGRRGQKIGQQPPLPREDVLRQQSAVQSPSIRETVDRGRGDKSRTAVDAVPVSHASSSSSASTVIKDKHCSAMNMEMAVAGLQALKSSKMVAQPPNGLVHPLTNITSGKADHHLPQTSGKVDNQPSQVSGKADLTSCAGKQHGTVDKSGTQLPNGLVVSLANRTSGKADQQLTQTSGKADHHQSQAKQQGKQVAQLPNGLRVTETKNLTSNSINRQHASELGMQGPSTDMTSRKKDEIGHLQQNNHRVGEEASALMALTEDHSSKDTGQQNDAASATTVSAANKARKARRKARGKEAQKTSVGQ